MEPISAAILAATNEQSRRLRELVRAPAILVMPGAYDVLSARLFEQMGFNADGERGYGDEVGVGDTVRALVARGVAGMNLEDGAAKGRGGLVELAQQLRKIKAVMETKRELGSEFFLNARVDAFHVTTDDPKKALEEAIRRGNAYAEAGGDCIFYLNLHSAETIGRVIKEVKAPVSILAGPQSPSVSELQDLGVARVSYGSAFLKGAIGATK